MHNIVPISLFSSLTYLQVFIVQTTNDYINQFICKLFIIFGCIIEDVKFLDMKVKDMMSKTEKTAKAIRVLTTVPVMAFMFLTILYKMRPELFGSITHYILLLSFLVLFPVLGYVLQPLLPHFKDKGREGQRNLVILMSFIGFFLGFIIGLFLHAPSAVFLIYLGYFISSIIIIIFNKLLHIRASGHTCGVAGPLSLLVYFISFKGLLISLILVPVYWASLKLKRHTLAQLIWGTFISICAFFIALFITSTAMPIGNNV